MSLTPTRYHASIILLHWLMFAGLCVMFSSGFLMTRLEVDQAFVVKLYQWHKASGIIILFAIVMRLACRLLTVAPPFPGQMSSFDKTSARLGHLAFYLLIFGMVLSGWVMVSSSAYEIPTIVFGLFEWPHLSGLRGTNDVEILSKEVHFFSAVGLLCLISIHILAVIKHRFIENINLIERIRFKYAFRVVLALFMALICVFSITDRSESDLLKQDTASPAASPSDRAVFTPQGRWSVDTVNSKVRFSGLHAGAKFEGHFSNWDTSIVFDEVDPDKSSLEARFSVASATTGDPLYDGTLSKAGWFDAERFPDALFKSTHITRTEKESYSVRGVLTMRGIDREVIFNMQHFSDTSVFKLSGQLSINRLDYDIGLNADPSAEWVSNEIGISFLLKADRDQQ